MGKINIRGGSPLRIDFEFASGDTAPGTYDVALKKVGNTYHLIRANGTRVDTKSGPAANMLARTEKQEVIVAFDE